jgi:hypothetical protein
LIIAVYEKERSTAFVGSAKFYGVAEKKAVMPRD